ncbi:DISARM system helicase DrmA [Pseudonocardia lutea]|uniref:DISARM system helicase DrmA n=1 Tax=Pseudonocardia lutea TaxID=2172015 RepID=A0ABW1I2L7_9PSEU
MFDDPRGEQGLLEDVPHPLDVPQEFAEASSFEVRDELGDLIARDLLGPWGGPEETFRPRARGPRDRYLVGMLGPRPETTSTRTQADRQPDTESGVYGDGEAELPEVFTPQNLGRMWASSMGVSFTVAADTDVVAVAIEWGQYAGEQVTGEDGKTTTVWRRTPHTAEREVRLDGPPTTRIGLRPGEDPDQVPTVYLAVIVRPRDGERVVQIVLVNGQREPESKVDTAWIFQARMTVTALDGAAPVFHSVDDPNEGGTAGEEAEDLHLRLLYRNQLRFAVGHNVAVRATQADGTRCANRLETTWLPTYDVPATEAAGSAGDAELSMDALASTDVGALRRGLVPLVEGYRTWLEGQAAQLPGLPAPLRGTGERAVGTAREMAARIEAGVALLTDPSAPGHAQAVQAFAFANRVMALQRRHTALGRIREEKGLGYTAALAEVEGPENARWRPFQLAFVLLNLPSLTDPTHPDRAPGHDARVDLLFFPTGGGKTEAYLGLTAFTFAIRRLQGRVGSGEEQRDGSDGVAVLMRYTLRLLTAQQFQRAAALVCAAEVVRREDEQTWGATPFRIGLWVGGKVSPNWYPQAAEQVAEAREAGQGRRVDVLQTLACPWCGTALAGHRDLKEDDTTRRVHLYCPNAEGAAACPFSRPNSAEGLPVLTVDEEIYRYTPALVIATVDKLAQLPWRGFAGALFGRVREQCPRHGYRHADLDQKTGCRSKHAAKGSHPAVTSRPVVRLRPPDLIIQDELHLISGALGTTVGLFEAAVAELCTWRVDGTEVGPTIVASTATTKNAEAQVRGVFGRRLAIFPPPVLDVADTYFSTQVEVTRKAPGRRYLGVCAHGVRLKSAEIRLAEILLLAGQTLFDRYGAPADPYMTLVGYFSATRELAGMRRYLDDDVTTRVRRHGTLKDLSNRLLGTRMLEIAELTSRISSADISAALKRLEVGFEPEFDTTDRKKAIVDEWRDVLGGKEPRREAHEVAQRSRGRDGAVDVVLATSMLQVGVDVSRFGLMVVTGQPKNTAEYIQASSRVGRDARRPGLVVTLYNWTRPRDLAHYEDFGHYHATFYKQVEALSVTPFTRRSLDRTTAGAVVAALRNVVDEHSHNPDARTVPLDGPIAKRVFDRMLARAQHVAGNRGREYLADRLARFTDLWRKLQQADDQALGYETATGKTANLRGLLDRAGNGFWGDQTVAMSMRETENEINLLVPADLSTPDLDAPPWDGLDGQAADPDPEPEGDEMGDTTLRGAAR